MGECLVQRSHGRESGRLWRPTRDGHGCPSFHLQKTSTPEPLSPEKVSLSRSLKGGASLAERGGWGGGCCRSWKRERCGSAGAPSQHGEDRHLRIPWRKFNLILWLDLNQRPAHVSILSSASSSASPAPEAWDNLPAPRPVCPEVSSLGWRGERVPLQLPASCPDSWLPPEAGQCREMFAPKQLRCLRNCPTLPRKEPSCRPTLRPPQSGDQRPELARWPHRGVGRAGGVSAAPMGQKGSSGSFLSRDWGFPSCLQLKENSVPACGVGRSQMVNIYLESRGPGFVWPEDDERSSLMCFEKCIHSSNKHSQPSGPVPSPGHGTGDVGVDEPRRALQRSRGRYGPPQDRTGGRWARHQTHPHLWPPSSGSAVCKSRGHDRRVP